MLFRSFGIAVYEAASAGVPLCLPDYGTFDIFKGSALFSGNHNPEKLAENIKKYLAEPELRKSNSEKAKIISSAFDYETVKKQYADLYKKTRIIP